MITINQKLSVVEQSHIQVWDAYQHIDKFIHSSKEDLDRYFYLHRALADLYRNFLDNREEIEEARTVISGLVTNPELQDDPSIKKARRDYEEYLEIKGG